MLTDRLVLAVPTLMTRPDPAAFDVEQALASQPLLQMVGHRCPGLSQQIAGFLGANRLTGMIQEAEDIQTLVALVAAGIGNAILRAVSASSPARTSPSTLVRPLLRVGDKPGVEPGICRSHPRSLRAAGHRCPPGAAASPAGSLMRPVQGVDIRG